MWIVSYVLDSILGVSKRSDQMSIISMEYERIAEYINKWAFRGATLIDGTGYYSKKDVKIIISVVRKKETADIFRKI